MLAWGVGLPHRRNPHATVSCNVRLMHEAVSCGLPAHPDTCLRVLLRSTSPRMMYWLTDIILKELKLGFAEATVLDALHPVRNFSR
jgi:DNA ligase N terminus